MRRPAVWISSLGLVLAFFLFFLYIFSPARHEPSRQPKIWISLSVCLGNATRLYHKVQDYGDHDDGVGRVAVDVDGDVQTMSVPQYLRDKCLELKCQV